MYKYLVSGTLSDADDAEAQAAAYPAALERYHEFLRSRDLSRAGDTLLYFGRDFFHDAGILGLSLDENGVDFNLRLAAWVDCDDSEAAEQLFTVRFVDVAWMTAERGSSYANGLETFLYSEIDGLQERIDTAQDSHDGEFHSLAIECVEGWIAVVFRSIRVTPDDPIGWAKLLRDPDARPNLYGLE